MRIISASRRTDIPAFYTGWFMNRIRAGDVRWVNPFSKAIHQVSLRPEDVMALVFWSKNYAPLLQHLDELDGRGFRMLFHFTITGLPRPMEPGVPNIDGLVATAQALSSRYGADAVLWRYDPIVISSITDAGYHLRRFEELCTVLKGQVKRCYFSFVVPYRKVQRNSAVLRSRTGIILHDPPEEEKIGLAHALSEVAAASGIEMFSCCGDYLVDGTIKKAHCVDAELLYRLYPDRIGRLSDLPSREGCGCCECTDIGAYDTCPHGCIYCYANARPEVAMGNHRSHVPDLDILGPRPQSEAINAIPELPLQL